MRAYPKGVIVALSLLCAGVLVSPSAQVSIQRGFDTVYNLTVQNVAKFADGTAAAPSITFASAPNTGFYLQGNQPAVSFDGVEIFRWGPSSAWLKSDTGVYAIGSAADVILARDAANILALRNGANAQTMRVGPSTGYAIVSDAGIGYSTGLGGAVTQITSKATGVTLNAVTGNITMEAGSLAADTAVSFTLTNSALAATDLVVVTHHSGGTAGAYTVVGQAAAGSAVITLRNVTAGALAEAVVLKFAVIKGAVS